MEKSKQSLIEKFFEAALWQSRLSLILVVIFGIVGAVYLFFVGSVEIWKTLVSRGLVLDKGEYGHMLIGIVGAIDLYLIGIVLLLFSFGIYELFISKIDIARTERESKILDIPSLDELKNRVLKVIAMVLIVSFFKAYLLMQFSSAQDVLFGSLAILAIAASIFLLRKKD